MRNKIIFTLVFIGLFGAVTSAVLYARPSERMPPAFNPAPNPYAAGIFANGIVESDQPHGQNVSIFPEVSGAVVEIFVTEGQTVTRGTPLFRVDDSVQRAIVAQQRAQAGAARALYDQLRAEPRPETLRVAQAQVRVAEANVRTAADQLARQQRSYQLDPRSVSRDVLDNAANAANAARANLDLATRQLDLTRAGAWSYEIRNQEHQYEALTRSADAADALLAKFIVRAPADGTVLSVGTSVGSYVSPQGTYDSYRQSVGPPVTMARQPDRLAVRCYIDEILIHRLPPIGRMQARMFIRGTNQSVPLEFVRVQPYVQPKIQLSNARTERVDVRVLPVIFRFAPSAEMQIYPGVLVDVYINSN